MKFFRHKTSFWLLLIIFTICSLTGCLRFWENYKLHRFSAEFIEWYQMRFPVEAGKKGMSLSLKELPDFSADSLRRLEKEVNSFRSEISDIKYQKLGETEKVDYNLLKQEIDRLYINYFLLKKWQKSADFYARKIQAAIYYPALLLTDSTRETVPLIIERLKKLPQLFSQLKANLDTISIEDKDVALERLMGFEKWISFDMRSQLREDFAKSDTSIHLIDTVNDSLLKLINFLENRAVVDENKLTPISGSEFKKIYRSYTGEELDAKGLLNLLSAKLVEIKTSMYNVAKEYFLLENKQLPDDDTLRIIRNFNDEIKKQMLRRDQIMKFITNLDGYTRRFIIDIAGLEVNIDYHIKFDWELFQSENPYQLAWRETFFRQNQVNFICRMTSVNGNRDLLQQLTILSRYNRPDFKRIYLTDILPVHLHNWHLNVEKRSNIVKYFPDEQFAKSFSLLMSEFLLNRGYSGYDRALKFSFLKKISTLILHSMIELKIYFDNWGEKEIGSFLNKNRDYYAASFEETKFNLYEHPAENLALLMGYFKLQLLRSQYEKNQQRSNHHQARFFQKILEQGAVPIANLKLNPD